jgi:transcriptional regulator with XRE-family HTH domain
MGHLHEQTIGAALRTAREQRRFSQLELALAAGISQRHLSYVENGKSMPSRSLLHDLFESLDLPLASRNALLLQAGFAPLYTEKPLADADMAPVKAALDALLHAHAPNPAMVLDQQWNLVAANQGVIQLVEAVGAQALLAHLQPGANLLDLLVAEGPFRSAIINFEEMLSDLVTRVRQESLEHPSMALVARKLEAYLPKRRHLTLAAPRPVAPVITTRFRTAQGELAFFSMFTTCGAPLDITAASLRVEHLFAADAATQAVVARWKKN